LSYKPDFIWADEAAAFVARIQALSFEPFQFGNYEGNGKLFISAGAMIHKPKARSTDPLPALPHASRTARRRRTALTPSIQHPW
jgi:hypothetical protein